MKINSEPILQNPDKPLLVLDLDETLIHSSKRPLYQKHSFRVFSYYVYERPDLKEFLINVSKIYSLAIWSAAADIYVKKVVENILPSSIIPDFIWGRSKCSFMGGIDREKNSDYLKNLHLLKAYGYSLQKILIVDDTPRVCLKNLANAIFPKAYYGEVYDQELQSLSKYLEMISTEKDFTIFEKKNWKKFTLS
jgi:RNA polymerase II subunit A small phosphatase-like protein